MRFIVFLTSSLMPCSLAAEDLSSLLAEAEARNPGLQAVLAEAKALESVAPRVSALPDPWLTFGFANEGLGHLTIGEAEMAGLSVAYSQEMPWPGKRPAFAREAEAEAAVGRLKAEAVRLDLRLRVKQAYFELFRAERSRELLEDSRTALRGLEATALSGHATGRGTLEASLKVQTEQTRLLGELRRTDAEVAASRARLNSLVGRDPGDPLVTAHECKPSQLPGREVLLERLDQAAPVRMSLGDLDARRAAAARAEADRKPDLMWMGRYLERAERDSVYELSLGIRLPAHARKKQDEAVKEARERERASRLGVEAARIEARAELYERLAEVERAERLLELYDQGVLEQSRATLQAAASEYAAGKGDARSWIEDFLADLHFRLDRVAEAAARERAVAAIEALTGETGGNDR